MISGAGFKTAAPIAAPIASARCRGYRDLYVTGTAVQCLTRTGPDQGQAQVMVDGGNVRTIDLYSPTPVFGVRQTFDGYQRGGRCVDRREDGHGGDFIRDAVNLSPR